MFGDRQFSEKSNKRAVSKEDFEQEQGAPATAWGEAPQPLYTDQRLVFFALLISL